MKRVSIYQEGVLVGSIPKPNMQPGNILTLIFDDRCKGLPPLKFFEDIHPGAVFRTMDFVPRELVAEDGWSMEVVLDADPSLGLGDLEALRGFVKTEEAANEQE